ncbi:competence type IV pilus minor pilin ComGF [Listeria sp. PSOL-1]|uniref:competence type IV pilus minor pilin ComGF n=1 Tax=Listeria sp. PSOL-1 TaxID=1844999 RepID=UPI0013CF94C2|nr:competence type IV pilus minor pilin ComGF [Listeria sp. PSOL-1]
MQNQQPLVTVRYRIKNSAGFTLIEAILTLIIATCMTTLIPIVILSLHSILDLSDMSLTSEWTIFRNQLLNEYNHSQSISSISKESLCLTSTKGLVCFTKYQDMIRKQINNKGHEPLLFQIKDIDIKKANHAIKINVELSNRTIQTMQLPLHPEVNEQ